MDPGAMPQNGDRLGHQGSGADNLPPEGDGQQDGNLKVHVRYFLHVSCIYKVEPFENSSCVTLRFGSWEDFSLSWWNALASAWLPASAILEVWHCGSNFLLVYVILSEKSWTDIRESWPSCPWQYFRSFDRGIVILSVFMAPDRVVLPASRNKSHRKLLTCFSERAALGLSFREHKRRNGQICPFSFEDIVLLTLDPGRVISNYNDNSRVSSCQLSSVLGGFRRFHFGWSFRFQQIIFHRC